MLVLTQNDIIGDGDLLDLEEQIQFNTIDLAVAPRGLAKKGGRHFQPRPTTRASTEQQRIRVERARYAQIEDSFRIHVNNAIIGLRSGNIEPQAFLKQFSSDLRKFQNRMYIQGKRTSGDISNSLSEEERRWLHGQHSSEMKYMHNFMRTMQVNGGRMRYDQRADLYALGGYSIYLRGVISGIPGVINLRWLWTLNLRAEHCPDCVNRHYHSRALHGVPTDVLIKDWGMPGERTQCLSRCRCSIQPIGLRIPTERTRPTSFRHVTELVRR
jgi:hypothetical protein